MVDMPQHYDIPSEPDDDPNVVMVPEEYVQTVGTVALLELRRRGVDPKRCQVAVNKEEPKVAITWERLTGGYYQQTTDCLPAYMAKRDPAEVGREAAKLFCARLEEVL